MKITRKEPEKQYKPIVVELETMHEATILRELLGNLTQIKDDSVLINFFNKLDNEMEEQCIINYGSDRDLFKKQFVDYNKVRFV